MSDLGPLSGIKRKLDLASAPVRENAILEESRFVYCAYFQFHQFGNKVRASRVKVSPTSKVI